MKFQVYFSGTKDGVPGFQAVKVHASSPNEAWDKAQGSLPKLTARSSRKGNQAFVPSAVSAVEPLPA